MPIYEYQCRNCGDEFEALQRVAERPLRRCKKCSGRLDKLISRTSFLLKGGGWYSEGYTRGGKKAPSSSSEAKPASSGKKSPGESKSDSKSERKSTTEKKSATA
jgi:putative FmdB family regulatory protein